jgi:hypothetical protein
MLVASTTVGPVDPGADYWLGRLSESIEAHLTIVFTALAVGHLIEHRTSWSSRKFVRTPPPLPHCPWRHGLKKARTPQFRESVNR